MTETGTLVHDAPEPPPPPHRSTGDVVRMILRGFGQTLITAGVVVLLFLVYEVYVTNWFADRAQAKVHSALEKEWANGDDPLLPLPGGGVTQLPAGEGIANLYIPRLGRDFAWTIVQGGSYGVSQEELNKGPVHYAGTALPGQRGNFGVAGHRVGHGEPFLNLDKLRPGDAVIVETAKDWYVYTVLGNPQTGDLSATSPPVDVPGREIVSPGDGDVLRPWPDHVTPSNYQPVFRLMTMTTCTPKFSATSRMIVHAQLTPGETFAKPKDDSPMPSQVKALYNEVSS